jgi:hypothetical protein
MTRSARLRVSISSVPQSEQRSEELRLLIVTGATVSSLDELPESVRALVDRASDVFVVTPSLPSRLQWLASDVDPSRGLADERLNAVLGQLTSMEVDATGRVGADDPLTAFGDAIREFRPDHILIGLRAADHAGWQERRLLDSVVANFHLPTTVFEIHATVGPA